MEFQKYWNGLAFFILKSFKRLRDLYDGERDVSDGITKRQSSVM